LEIVPLIHLSLHITSRRQVVRILLLRLPPNEDHKKIS